MAHRFFILIVFLACCVCTTAQDHSGKIIFFRASHIVNSDYRAFLFCDGMKLGRIGSGNYLEATAPAGRHICVAESADGPPTTIDIVPGDVVYFRIEVDHAKYRRHAFLIATTESEFKQEKKLTPMPAIALNTSQPIELLSLTVPVAQMNPETHESTANFGDLAVTATNSSTDMASSAGGRNEVGISLTFKNAGTHTVCASFAGKLIGTYGFEYIGVPAGPPPIRDMLPGENVSGGYVFDVKAGVRPSVLILDLERGSIRCEPSGHHPPEDAAIPKEIRLDVQDLPGANRNNLQPAGSTHVDKNGVTYPRCVYCPQPNYSKKARGSRLEGTIQMKVSIGIDGVVSNVDVVSGIAPEMDAEAVQAVQKWHFKPAIGPNGEPIAFTVPIEIMFRMLK